MEFSFKWRTIQGSESNKYLYYYYYFSMIFIIIKYLYYYYYKNLINILLVLTWAPRFFYLQIDLLPERCEHSW